jgi:excisionase family DNA binding protein
MPVPTQKPLLNDELAAIKLCVTPRMVRRLWQTRQLTGVRVGRLVRFTEEDLDAYIDRQRIPAIVAPLAPTKSSRPLQVRPSTNGPKGKSDGPKRGVE